MKKEITKLSFIAIGILLLNILLVSASNQFEDIFSRYDLGTIGFIISLIPLIVLIILSYISIKRGSRTLMTIQIVLWWVFTIYVAVRAYAFLDSYLNLGFMPKTVVEYFTTNNVPTDKEQHYWYVISLFANAIIGLIFSFKNKYILNLFLKFKR